VFLTHYFYFIIYYMSGDRMKVLDLFKLGHSLLTPVRGFPFLSFVGCFCAASVVLWLHGAERRELYPATFAR